jgi:hypothetical protein
MRPPSKMRLGYFAGKEREIKVSTVNLFCIKVKLRKLKP